jgi:plasmid stabilization system protein ParE
MYEVQWTSLAKDDLVCAVTYIADILKAPLAAEKLLNDLEKETAVLAENPYLFPPWFRRHEGRYRKISLWGAYIFLQIFKTFNRTVLHCVNVCGILLGKR